MGFNRKKELKHFCRCGESNSAMHNRLRPAGTTKDLLLSRILLGVKHLFPLPKSLQKVLVILHINNDSAFKLLRSIRIIWIEPLIFINVYLLSFSVIALLWRVSTRSLSCNYVLVFLFQQRGDNFISKMKSENEKK